ncbi:MAG: DNA adenine methylase, partial [Fimbriimonadaceae bacterium]
VEARAGALPKVEAQREKAQRWLFPSASAADGKLTRRRVAQILETAAALGPMETVCDLFSGTSRVGRAFKEQGCFVHANDALDYAYVVAKALVAADARDYPRAVVEPWIDRLNALPDVDGWYTQTFCRDARYFQPASGMRIDAIRPVINEVEDVGLKAILLTSLLLAADRVDSTTAVQMAYLKRWSDRSFHPLQLQMPPLLAGAGRASMVDALKLKVSADLVYLDPPYNNHSYLGNYHVWQTICLDDRPETYGIANKRTDCRTIKSPFNLKVQAVDAMRTVISNLDSKFLMISFNNEGHISLEEMEEMLHGFGRLTRHERAHKRYIGSQIGIHNLLGVKVGTVSHTSNREFLFVVERA